MFKVTETQKFEVMVRLRMAADRGVEGRQELLHHGMTSSEVMTEMTVWHIEDTGREPWPITDEAERGGRERAMSGVDMGRTEVGGITTRQGSCPGK